MRRWIMAVGVALAFTTLSAVAPTEARAGKHKDEKLGYSFNYPKKWEKMPLGTDTKSLVARFSCHREYEWNDSKSGGYTRHKPRIDVVVIRKGLKKKSADVSRSGSTITIDQGVRYTNVREYLDSAWQGRGGFHFSAEDEGEVGGLPVKMYELTVDKLVNGERRVYGWEFETEDAYYGLVCEILAQEEKKLKPMVLKSFRSFKAFPRTGALPGSVSTGPDDGGVKVDLDDPDGDEDDAATREEKRKAKYRRRLAKFQDTLTDGWAYIESKNFIAVSHTDKKYAKEVLNQAEAVRAWLDKSLGYVGDGYAGKIIIVIADSAAEATGLRGSWWAGDRVDILFWKEVNSTVASEFRNLNSGIYRIWLRDKNKDLGWRAPYIISAGIRDFVQSGRAKGKKLVFRAMGWDKEKMKELERGDKLITAKEFFGSGRERLGGDWDNLRQLEYFAGFLLDGKGSSSSKYKNLLKDYVTNFVSILAETEAEEDDEPDASEATNEEEETAAHQARQTAWKEKEQQTLDALMSRTFEGWSDKDWKKLDALYRKGL